MAAPMGRQIIRCRHSLVAAFVALVLYFAAIFLIYQLNSETKLRGIMHIFHLIILGQVVLTMMSMYLWKQLVTNISKKPQNDLKSSWPNPKTRPEHDISLLLMLWKLIVFIFLFLAQVSIGIGWLLPAGKTPYSFVIVCYSCLGIYAILFGVLLPLELLEFLMMQRGLSHKVGRGIKVFAVVSVSISLAIHGLYKASEGPIVKHVQIPVHKLPKSFHDMTVVQLSDIHLGPTVGGQQMKDVVSKVNKLKPDLVVITGDLVEAPVETLANSVEPLSDIKSKYGTFFSTGNHEYHAGDVDNWFDHLEFLGVQCLHNKHVQIKHETIPSDWFYLAGTDDWHAYMFGGDHGFDLDQALRGTDRDHAVILMAHQPNAAKAALNSKYDISLILSGHTHGGQFFPMNIFIYLANPFYAGLYHVKNHSYVYVSSGTWYFGPPIRIFSTPEITYITLLAH